MSFTGKVGQKLLDFKLSNSFRVFFIMKQDKFLYPLNIRFFSPETVMAYPDGLAIGIYNGEEDILLTPMLISGRLPYLFFIILHN